jgi:hypothetical protein
MSSRLTRAKVPTLETGSTFADYRIERLAGRQRGMGRVYAATHLESERHLEFPPWPVALKVFSPPEGQDAEFRARFEEAAALQAGLHHANIVSTYEVGTDPLPFMSMTLFQGPNLADLIASRLRQLDEPALLPIISSVAAALEAGIASGLVYRRLRPGGVLVAADGQRAFLSDFGVGRATRVSDLLATEELGTFVDYISPEEVRGDEVTVASNVYSLAAMAFECLTGEPPYPRQEAAHSMQARLDEPPRPLRESRPDLSTTLETVLARALDRDPGKRPESPGRLAAAIERAYPKHRRLANRLRATTAVAGAPALPSAKGAADRTAAPPAPAAIGDEPTAAADEPRAAALSDGPPRAERKRRHLLSPAVGLVALLAAAAAALGALLAPGPVAEVARTPAAELAAGTVNLRYPGTWNRLGAAPGIPGLNLRDSAALAPGGGRPAARPARALVVGHMALDAPNQLPPGLLRELPRRPTASAVDLGRVQAYRYRGLAPNGLGRMNLYVVPTTGDAAVMACLAPAASDRFMGQCERAASTLRLTESRPLTLAPSATYARGLTRIVNKLNAARSFARRRLAAAATPNGQAGNTARLAIAYRAARRSASRLAPPPGATTLHRRTAAALARAERSYRALAAAARARASGAWRRRSKTAVSSEQALQQALRDLQALGFQPQAGT